MFSGSQIIGRDSFGLEKVKQMNRHQLNHAGLQVVVLLMIAGHATAGEQLIDVQHDSVRGVTCWILNNTGISCMPDSSFQHQQQSTPSSESGRASQASSSAETSPLQATPAPGEERLQL